MKGNIKCDICGREILDNCTKTSLFYVYRGGDELKIRDFDDVCVFCNERTSNVLESEISKIRNK